MTHGPLRIRDKSRNVHNLMNAMSKYGEATTFLCNLCSFGLEVLSRGVWCGFFIMWRDFVIMRRGLMITCCVSIMM